ncbi:hypothetical protein HYH03_009231 [Edaphochlamys debaryana]|uniref:Uncharacterized protein n=1 Tax=Edaphochlamys debaryana TaxID=47281 RepID=A0A835XZG5_9CHLO|nr:hypothetical protein HYH03_009231 [Edaphochlamys debaryana]|eukprot:KAG2492569.1 hypothetical protein HYH03_009231 [Edaphochlamys debaryana]
MATPRASLDLSHPQLRGKCGTALRSRCPLLPARTRRPSAARAAPRSEAVQSSGAGTVSSKSPSSTAASSKPTPCPFDTDYWHYSRSWPWWQRRQFVVPAGIGFIVAANLLEEPGLKTTLMAAIPVALLWYVALVLLPQNFKTYCNEWVEAHPESRPPQGRK